MIGLRLCSTGKPITPTLFTIWSHPLVSAYSETMRYSVSSKAPPLLSVSAKPGKLSAAQGGISDDSAFSRYHAGDGQAHSDAVIVMSVKLPAGQVLRSNDAEAVFTFFDDRASLA